MTTEETITEEREAQAVFEGVLLGTAVGDALGLPAENLSPGRIHQLWKGEWKMRFVFGYGMTSDDTEHAWMVAQTLLSHPIDVTAFQSSLAWKLRWWFASLPAGVGLATAKACLKLWMGFPPAKSGVDSAGNGPAMRGAILGAFFAEDTERRRHFVQVSSRLTHRNWKAETAALAVAETAALAVRRPNQADVSELLPILRELSPEKEWQDRMAQIELALERNDSVKEFVRSIGLTGGVSGYSLNAVPVALYAWCQHRDDFWTALTAVIECGGDTDTVGAIVGALCGASCGPDGIPQEWLNRLVEWPRSVAFMQAVAQRLSEQKNSSQPLGEIHYFWPGLIPRNIMFLIIVILHGFRRLLPPY